MSIFDRFRKFIKNIIFQFKVQLFKLNRNKNSRLQRVYLKHGIGPMEFLDKINQRKVEYVLLRWWENLPDYPAGEDINILVLDDHRDLINDLVSKHKNGGIKCDIYTVKGSRNGSRFGIPVFPLKLSQALLNERYLFKGAYVPSPLPYFASVAYHALFHKVHNSGIPGFGKEPTKFVFDYVKALEEMKLNLGINVEISAMGLYDWLKIEGYAPQDDILTLLANRVPELIILQKRLH